MFISGQELRSSSSVAVSLEVFFQLVRIALFHRSFSAHNGEVSSRLEEETTNPSRRCTTWRFRKAEQAIAFAEENRHNGSEFGFGMLPRVAAR